VIRLALSLPIQILAPRDQLAAALITRLEISRYSNELELPTPLSTTLVDEPSGRRLGFSVRSHDLRTGALAFWPLFSTL
jgi:hypothetical protein